MMIKGYTLMHEHVTIDLSGVKQDIDCHLDCMEETIQEFKELYQLGVRNIVDVTNEGMGRNPSYLEHVSKMSGIHIIQSTGFYKEPFLPNFVYEQSVEELAAFLCHEIEHNIDSSQMKARMIGEIGTSKNQMTELEQKVFDAAVIAHKQTKAPIYTHTTLGTYALEQIAYFKTHQVALEEVVIGHIDLSDDINYILEVLRSGVNVGFDTIGKNNYVLDDHRIQYLLEIEKQGFIDQVVLSLDLTRKSHLKYKNGIGYAYLFTDFIPRLLDAGMKQSSIDRMLIDNPLRILKGDK